MFISRMILHYSARPLIALAIWVLLYPTLVYSEEQQHTTAQEVDRLLGQLNEKGKILEVSAQLYRMGPGIDPILLQKLKEISLEKMGDPYNSGPQVIAATLSNRGYDREILDILKSMFRDKDPNKRFAAAIMIALNYSYFAINDLAGIVSEEKDAVDLTERKMYEWSASMAEVIQQILEVFAGESQLSKDFVLSLMKTYDLSCPDCGYDPGRWSSFLETITEDMKFV